MEGTKPFEVKPQSAEVFLTPEKMAESIERAKEIHVELLSFNNVEMVGEEAMDLNAQAEKLSAELTEALKYIPAKECMENELPYHPSDEKRELATTTFPKQPDYPLDYIPSPSINHAKVDQEQAA